MRAFLSHSSADNVLAKKIYTWLRDQAVSVWFDRIELRPGDSLLKSIAQGITHADALLVLVTENSNNSPWVEKEVGIAVTKEMNKTGPRVIPIRYKDCPLPTMLVDKIYITVDQTGTGFADIIPAIFRDSYILDIILNEQSLGLDVDSLKNDLYEYVRSKFDSIRIRITEHNFTSKVITIASKASSKTDIPVAVIQQIKRTSEFFSISLPLYWSNLSDLLAQLITEIFNYYGKSFQTLEIVIKAVVNTFRYYLLYLYTHINKAIFPSYADDFGFPDIAAYLQEYEKYVEAGLSDYDEKIVREIWELYPDDNLVLAGLEGNHQKKIVDCLLWLAKLSEIDRLELQIGSQPSALIHDYTWYVRCLPQILAGFLKDATFDQGKPLYELEYKAGLKTTDYNKIGLH